MRSTPKSPPAVAQAAKHLRKAPTPAEVALWRLLRDNRFRGLKFRRQVALGPFIADFFCLPLQLVIEVDGGVHATAAQQARDENREAYLREQGFTVLRFSNEEILDHPEATFRRLEGCLRGCP